jgi:hypothetical protein
VDDGEGDYLNCPFTKAEYDAFYDALTHAESATEHDFDTAFFEGCLPIEVIASRGVDTLRFGPMKPVGLLDPRTGRRPFAVVQLRQDNLAASHFSVVGFQTQLKWSEQARVLRMIPGLERAEFVRCGMVHRNTFINGPKVLRPTWQTKVRDDLFFAGQISGVEGYVESAASGLIAGRNAARVAQASCRSAAQTAIGALAQRVTRRSEHYQPSNITFGIMPPLERRRAALRSRRSNGRLPPRPMDAVKTPSRRSSHLAQSSPVTAFGARLSDVERHLSHAADAVRAARSHLDATSVRAFVIELNRRSRRRRRASCRVRVPRLCAMVSRTIPRRAVAPVDRRCRVTWAKPTWQPAQTPERAGPADRRSKLYARPASQQLVGLDPRTCTCRRAWCACSGKAARSGCCRSTVRPSRRSVSGCPTAR